MLYHYGGRSSEFRHRHWKVYGTTCQCFVGFEFASYSFNEDAGVVMVTINSSAALPPNATIQVSGGTAFIYDVTVKYARVHDDNVVILLPQ